VLVHGAFADSSGFDGVIDRLRRDGYQVGAAPNRLLGLQSDAATVRGFLDSVPGRRRQPLRSDNRRGYFQVSIKGPKILVGHSYGGAVITWATSAAGVCPSSAGIGDSSHVSM
jgi:pimeloyl-ACP methyl ester carboxylesterase